MRNSIGCDGASGHSAHVFGKNSEMDYVFSMMKGLLPKKGAVFITMAFLAMVTSRC